MAFTRAKPGGWSANEKLTSAQMNALDIDHSNSIDRTGDTLTSGTLALTSTASIVGAVSNAIRPTVAGGIRSTVAGGIDGNANAAIRASAAAGITSNIAGGISAGVAGGIVSTVDGGIKLNGTSADNIVFSSARQHTVIVPPAPISVTTGWSYASPGYVLNGPGTTQAIWFEILAPHDGSQILSVVCAMAVTAIHGSITSMALPSFDVLKVNTIGAGNAYNAEASLRSGGPVVFPTPSDATAYYNSGLVQNFSYVPDQNNTVNRGTSRFLIKFVDEHSTNAQPNSTMLTGFLVTFGAIADMRFA